MPLLSDVGKGFLHDPQQGAIGITGAAGGVEGHYGCQRLHWQWQFPALAAASENVPGTCGPIRGSHVKSGDVHGRLPGNADSRGFT